MPLAGSRDSVPCGVWGNAPTVPRATNSKEEVNKGAGSEASLPVTSRSRRSAPQAALSTTCTLSRQMGATDQHREKSFLGAGLFCCREISPLRRRPEGFAVALWTPSHCTPMFLDFSCYRGYRACGRDKSATKQGIPFRERPALMIGLVFQMRRRVSASVTTGDEAVGLRAAAIVGIRLEFFLS